MLTHKLQSADALPRELADNISSEVNRLSSLVTQFLNFARPLHAELHPASLTDLLDRVLKKIADQWKGKPVHVERDYAPDLPQIPLDESLCEQAFINLVQNAYEAMEEKGGTLRVAVAPANHSARPGVIVHLSDNGPGVPDALREEIFNPFVTTKKTGVGLGLSIVAQIIDGHHGSIRVDNAPEGGAVFTIFFPSQEKSTDQAESWPWNAGRGGEHLRAKQEN